MTPEEAASKLARQVEEADDDAILAAEAFAFGMADEYLAYKQADIRKRLGERFPEPVRGSGGEAS